MPTQVTQGKLTEILSYSTLFQFNLYPSQVDFFGRLPRKHEKFIESNPMVSTDIAWGLGGVMM